MLRDPKAHALAENFGGQWLQFRALESLTRDRDKFPEFEDYLRLSMRRETELFFETIVREDRSVLDFINGRYSFLNERLARHYGVPNVIGAGVPAGRFDRHAARRRADAGQHPGSVSSYATRTSPVLRGKWVLDNLLERPAAGAAGRRPQSRRDRRSARRRRCASSSRSTARTPSAPPAIAAWIRSASASRTSTPSARGATTEGKFPIDASGQLPDGRKFTGPERAARHPLGRPRRLRARDHVEAADLRARPRPRALRRADREAHRQPAARATTTSSRASCSKSSTACRSSRGGRRRMVRHDDEANCHRVGKRRVRIGAPLRQGRRTDQAEALERGSKPQQIGAPAP